MNRHVFLIVAVSLCYGMLGAWAQERERFVGGLTDDAEKAEDQAKPVRNDSAKAGEEIVTKRYFRIQKGAYPEFVEASRNGVWPYFEKIGARVIGMWKVIHPEGTGTEESPDYDEVYLVTRYASVEHWRATRAPVKHGGNGPDWDACLAALLLRHSLTLETRLEFMQGLKWDNSPWYLPGLDEKYEKVDE